MLCTAVNASEHTGLSAREVLLEVLLAASAVHRLVEGELAGIAGDHVVHNVVL
jgi:hypothetical protein